MNPFKTLWIWGCRFRKRKGYGVHSPFAYNFIRFVINEKDAYYTYQDLKDQRQGKLMPEKVDRLLFRLSNEVQPETIVQVGEQYPLSLRYLQAGCTKASVALLGRTENPEQALRRALNGKGLHLFFVSAEENLLQWVKAALAHTDQKSLFIIDGIHSSKEMRAWWKDLQQREETGITFDLYEVGLIFFDKSRIKQHYKVNFV